MMGDPRGNVAESKWRIVGAKLRRWHVLWSICLVLLAPSGAWAQDAELEVLGPGDQSVSEPGEIGAPARDEPDPGVSAAEVLTSDYALRLQALEDRVNDLKEEIFRSKSRLVLLRERVLQTAIGGSQAIISHVNDMSATFDLYQVIYSLDGNQIFSATDSDGSLADQDRIEIYNGAIVPGPHNLAVEVIFIGNGFGLFSYLEGYRFRLRSSYPFTAEEGNVTYLDVVAYEKGGVNQPIEERPDIRYELEYTDSSPSLVGSEE